MAEFELQEGAVVRIVPLVNEGEFVHDPLTCRWTHPETGVVIDDEHMPIELMPEDLVRSVFDHFLQLGMQRGGESSWLRRER